MATVAEVEEILFDLVKRVERIDPSYRAMLPSRRTIQAECPDLDLVYHAFLRHGKLSELHEGPADRYDIRVRVDSDDLIAMHEGELDPARAYGSGRIRLDASMTDLLRLRAVM